MIYPTVEQLKATCTKLGYTLKTDAITTFGIRNYDMTAGQFNDVLGVYIPKENKVILRSGTVDPGSYYINNPMNPDGCAVMKYGHYKDSYCVGKHKGYDALVQCKPIDFYRITKVKFSLDNKDVPRGKWKIIVKGAELYNQLIGANQHRANPNTVSTDVGQWSAGCQVTNQPKEYKVFIDTCMQSGQKYFDYILFSETDFV